MKTNRNGAARRSHHAGLNGHLTGCRSRRGCLRKSLPVAALAGLALLMLSGCNHPSASASAASPAESGSPQASYFTVSKGQMAHLQVVHAQASNIPRSLRFPGSVAYNEFETTPVITQVSGPVFRVLVLPGQIVRMGQPMIEVTSPDYVQMRDNYLKARDSFDLAEKILRRSQDLYAHHAISMSALEQAQSTSVEAQADLTAAWQALKVIGFNNPQQVMRHAVSPEIPLLAPIGGEVVERTVAPGQVIQAGATQCFVISNMRTVWVLANVYQSDLGTIHQGDTVTIQTDAYPGVFHGRISYIAPALDPTTRTLQVRIVTPNPDGKLKKDMYVTVSVNAAPIRNALTVPNSAVLRNAENQPFVYVTVGTRQFAQRLITIGTTQGGRTQVLSGLEAGDEVVADGSLFLQFANSFQH